MLEDYLPSKITTQGLIAAIIIMSIILANGSLLRINQGCRVGVVGSQRILGGVGIGVGVEFPVTTRVGVGVGVEFSVASGVGVGVVKKRHDSDS